MRRKLPRAGGRKLKGSFNPHKSVKEVIFSLCMLITCPSFVVGQVSDFNKVDFARADSVALLYPHHSLKDLRSLSIKLTSPLSTDVEKFRSIYKWICLNIDNDYGLFLENQAQRTKQKSDEDFNAWNKEFSARVFRTLLKQHKTVCTGYAYLLRELCSHAEIKTQIINGYGRTVQANIGGPGAPNHSWNAVQLNGKWYLCDPTWSSGAILTEVSSFVRKFDEAYFLTDPISFVSNHYPMDSSWVLLKEPPSLSEFLNRPIVYSSAIKNGIVPITPEMMKLRAKKIETISFRFKKPNGYVIDKLNILIGRSSISQSVKPEIQDVGDAFTFQHTFKRSGEFVVHIMVDGEYWFTYEVDVD
jgi:hypothetical protein